MSGAVARSLGSGHSAYRFREAGRDDFDSILALYRQLHPHDPAVENGSDEAAFERILTSPGLYLFVLELDGAVVATTYLNVIPNLTRSASPYAVVENVVVEERLRGTGLGKRIMGATLDAAWSAGCYKAMLMTGSRTPSTHAFYRACGFSPDAKTAYLARPPGHDDSRDEAS
jgi:GNAT superfamily N-acetyltransferase